VYKPISIAVVLNCGAKIKHIRFPARLKGIFYLNELLMLHLKLLQHFDLTPNPLSKGEGVLYPEI
jgi:hypothetical protein